MAEPIVYTIDDLKLRLAELFIECNARAKREDELARQIADLTARLAAKEAT